MEPTTTPAPIDTKGVFKAEIDRLLWMALNSDLSFVQRVGAANKANELMAVLKALLEYEQRARDMIPAIADR